MSKKLGHIIVFEQFCSFSKTMKLSSVWVQGLIKNSLFTESGCVSLPFLKSGQIVESYRGAVVKFLCNPGYSLFGSSFMYCDGTVWNGTIPECKGDVPILNLK
jgi:hypothetical protein